MVSPTPGEVNSRNLRGTFIVSFSFQYLGLTLNDATSLVIDRKLGENEREIIETAVRYMFPSRCCIGTFTNIFVQITFSGEAA